MTNQLKSIKLNWYQRMAFWFVKDGYQQIGRNLCSIMTKYPLEVRKIAYPKAYAEYGLFLQKIMKEEHEEHIIGVIP